MKATGIVLLIVAVIMGAWSAYQLADPIVEHKMFASEVQDIVDEARTGNRSWQLKEIKEETLEKVKKYELPIEEKDIEISDPAWDRQNFLRLEWTRTVDLFGYYQKTYEFKVEHEGFKLK